MDTLQAVANLALMIGAIAATVTWIASLCNYDGKEPACKPEECDSCPFPCDGYEKQYKHILNRKEKPQ